MRLAGRLFLALVLLAALLSTHSSGHDVITTPITFSGEISRLFYSRCVACHRPGGIAFSLMTYEEARPWAKAIQEEVLERRMPPWGAVKGFGDFQNDQGLTQEQLELIAEWVEGGAPGGDPKYLPKTPVFQSDRALPVTRGIPIDDTLTLKTTITVTGVRTKHANEGASFMAVAEFADGTVEPLLWIYNYKPRFDRAYWYNASVRLPAGTRITVTPQGAGGIALLTEKVANGHAPK